MAESLISPPDRPASATLLDRLVAVLVTTVLVTAALAPTALTTYLYATGANQKTALLPDFHVVVITLAIGFSAFVSYVTYRAYLTSQRPFKKWLLWGLIAFTVIYAPHGFLTNVALNADNPWLFLLFGPSSRLVMGACFLLAALAYGRDASQTTAVKTRRSTAAWMVFCVLISVAVGASSFSAIAGEQWYRWTIELAAMAALAASVFVLWIRGARSAFMLTLMMVEVMMIQSSFAFLLAKAWSHLWWYAHIVFAAGFLVLSYQIARAYLLGVSFENVFSQAELLTKLQEANTRYQRSNNELSQFAHLVSHDLQAPLRRMRTFVELVSEEVGDSASEQLKTSLSYIRTSSDQLKDMVQRILELSSVNSQALRIEPVDLTSLLKKVMELFSDEFSNLHAEWKIASDLPTLNGDRLLLFQVFQNLIQNAIKYRRPDIALKIDVRAHKQGPCWVIDVQDNGRGFKNEEAPRAFAMLSRLHGEGVSGSGAGLAICRRIVERHGGYIDVTAEVNVGATFHAHLPANPEADKRCIHA